jgi:NAD(P)-dependent dehydrogenase (short-subunit alcohol dehydrogenase family)
MRGARRQGPRRRQAAELGGELRDHRQRGGRPVPSVDILVVASGQNKVSKIVDQKADDFLDVMDANVTQSWLMARPPAGRC